MRAQIELYRNRVWLEIALALLASTWVAWVLLGRADDLFGVPFDRFAHFPLSVGIGVWLPLLARIRTHADGELAREGDALVLRSRFRTRRFPLRSIHAVRVAPGERGASLVMELDDGGVLAVALDDLEDARRLATEIRDAAQAGVSVMLPLGRLGRLMWFLRPFATICALAYYLHVVQDVIPGDKALYGIPALLAGIALLVLHLARHRHGPLASLVPWTPALPLWEHTPAMRAHLRAHRLPGPDAPEASTSPPRPRLAEHGEPLGAWLGRVRRELVGAGDYRGLAAGIRTRLEHAFRSHEVPLRERALALRVLSASEPGEVRRRIAEMDPLPEEEEAWLEAVALAADDGEALAKVGRRPPEFVG